MKLPKIAIVGIVLGVVLIAALGSFAQINSIRNEVISKEENLTATYKQNMIALDTFVSSSTETMGVANAASDKIGAIMAEAITGRYATEDPQAQNGKLFSALTEAYPDFSKNAELFAKAQDAIMAGRQKFADSQTRMASAVANYRKYIDQGIFRSMAVGMLGAPSDRIRITMGNKVAYTGKEALVVMETVIMSSSSQEAIETGTLEPLDFSGTAK